VQLALPVATFELAKEGEFQVTTLRCEAARPPEHPVLNLHKSRVRRARGFLPTAFSNATPHTFFQP